MENNKQRTLCKVYSRVCGWLVNKDAFNKGKEAEALDRVEFKIKE